MAQNNDPLDNAVRIADISDSDVVAGTVRKAPGTISRDDQDEYVDEIKELESGLRIADDEFDGVTVGGLLGSDIDPDLVQFDDDGNIIKKKPKDGKKKKKNGEEDDEFADDDDDDEVVVLGDEEV